MLRRKMRQHDSEAIIYHAHCNSCGGSPHPARRVEVALAASNEPVELDVPRTLQARRSCPVTLSRICGRRNGGRGDPAAVTSTMARNDQFTRDQFWPPQNSPPKAQPSTRNVLAFLSRMLPV